MLNILSYKEFLNESESYDLELDKRFQWVEKIESLADQIVTKSNYLRNNFNYDRHDGDGFEFDIKARNWPDNEDLSKKYGFSEEEIQSMWDLFMRDNLEMYGNDIIENDPNFTDWFTTGRSGGWLLLKHISNLSNLIEDPVSVIEDDVSYLNDLTDQIEDEEYQEWEEFMNIAGSGARLLGRMDIEVGDFENVKYAEDESKVAIASLQNRLEELVNLERSLDKVENLISSFWEDAQVNFEEYVKEESENKE
jgi:hypothetical protein